MSSVLVRDFSMSTQPYSYFPVFGITLLVMTAIARIWQIDALLGSCALIAPVVFIVFLITEFLFLRKTNDERYFQQTILANFLMVLIWSAWMYSSQVIFQSETPSNQRFEFAQALHMSFMYATTIGGEFPQELSWQGLIVTVVNSSPLAITLALYAAREG